MPVTDRRSLLASAALTGGALLAPALTAMQELPFGRDMTLRRLLPQISRPSPLPLTRKIPLFC